MSYKEEYIKEHSEFVKAQADKYALKNYPPGTKVIEAELEDYFRAFYEQFNQLEKAITEKEEAIIQKAMQDGKTDVLELEKELVYISHRQIEDFRNLYRAY
jgi:Skp family chaperone for outer membrane proteins